jgi:hypothetical protein
MLRNPSVCALVAALVFAGAASSPQPALALPHFGFHHHPANPSDTRIYVELYNKNMIFRDVKIANHVYTVQPHESIRVTAPAGTPIYTAMTVPRHAKGDLLFWIAPAMNNTVINLD